tara:strand:- start:423 stop:806 length:384 start_codon:yes stop_codon:yes gene_type:complete
MTNQDILRTMMTQLDEASNTIPEGFYIQFCDHLQNLHRGEHDEDTGEHAREIAERAELCHRQVMLLVYPIWYLGIAIYYLSRFVYLCLKGIHSIIKAQRESQTPMDKYGTIYVSEREWFELIGVGEE